MNEERQKQMENAGLEIIRTLRRMNATEGEVALILAAVCVSGSMAALDSLEGLEGLEAKSIKN